MSGLLLLQANPLAMGPLEHGGDTEIRHRAVVFGGEAMTIGDGNRHDNSERGMVALSERQIPWPLPIAHLPFARAWKRDVETEDER